jgi:hypothetical protein
MLVDAVPVKSVDNLITLKIRARRAHLRQQLVEAPLAVQGPVLEQGDLANALVQSCKHRLLQRASWRRFSPESCVEVACKESDLFLGPAYGQLVLGSCWVDMPEALLGPDRTGIAVVLIAIRNSGIEDAAVGLRVEEVDLEMIY